MSQRMRVKGSDDGAMLIIALGIITVVAVVTAALLTLGSTKFIATVNLRQVASNGYAADAAAKIAIGDLELGSSAPGFGGLPSTASSPWVFDNSADGTGCFGGKDGSNGAVTATSSLNLNSFYIDSQSKVTKNATVTCAVVPGTGIFGLGAGAGGTGSVSGAGSGRSVTLLGSAGGSFSSKSTGYMIHGDVMSRGPISGDQVTTGTVSASICDPTSGQAGTHCPYGGTVDDPYAGVGPNITSVPTTLGTWSGCTFQPGYYNNALALNTATDACGTATFAPGNYYFDFHNNTTDPTYSSNSGISSGADLWSINNTVIGGQATGSATSPGMCKNPIDDITAQGVQFIFGGDSRMTVAKDGILELCGSYNNGAAPIVIYGLDGSSASRGQLVAGYATTTSPTVTAGTVVPTGFSAAPLGTTDVNALTTNGDAKVESFSTLVGNSTATLTLSGFNPGTSIPAGSTVKSVTLNVWHTETAVSGKSNSVAPSLTYTVGGGGANNTSNQPATKSSLGLDSIDLSSDLGPVIAAGNLGSTSLKFTETTKGSTSSTVDAAQLVISYYPPSWRGETNTAIPSNCVLANSCDLFGISASGGSGKGSLVVNGATYIPVGSISANISNNAGTVAFRWGLVANTASFSGWPQSSFAGYPLVSIPDAGPGVGSNVTAVDLKVYLCASGICGTSGPPALTARVLITDPINTTTNIISPYPNARQINVLSWAEQK